jgi:hypothetical protein
VCVWIVVEVVVVVADMVPVCVVEREEVALVETETEGEPETEKDGDAETVSVVDSDDEPQREGVDVDVPDTRPDAETPLTEVFDDAVEEGEADPPLLDVGDGEVELEAVTDALVHGDADADPVCERDMTART